MNILANINRISHFFWYRKNELHTKEFWDTVGRVIKTRFSIVDRVSDEQFRKKLSMIELRPYNLHIELTNICNANCIFCAYQYQKRPKVLMEDRVFFKTLDDYCAIGGGELMLKTTVGDPALDPNFLKRIRAARSRPEITRIETITNGINLHKIGIETLVHSGLSFVMISTGPWERELYEKIYRTRSYEKMRKNVKKLLELNKAAGCPLEVTIAFRTNLTMKQTRTLPDYQEIRDLPHMLEFNTDFDTWRGAISPDDLLPGMHLRPPSFLGKEPCECLYHGPIVFADGTVGMCGSRDYNANSELILGNIMESNLQALWVSAQTKRLRERFGEGDFPDICSSCTKYCNLDIYRSVEGTAKAGET